jgi:hypothetical protein
VQCLLIFPLRQLPHVTRREKAKIYIILSHAFEGSILAVLNECICMGGPGAIFVREHGVHAGPTDYFVVVVVICGSI